PGPGGLRSTEQVTLAVTAAERDQAFALDARLDALRDRLQVQRAGQREDRADHGMAAVPRVAEFRDKRTIDLERLQREMAQVAQRRVAGAEIVERDTDPDLAQAPDRRLRLGRVLEQHV